MSLTMKTVLEKLYQTKRADKDELKIFMEHASTEILNQQAQKYLDGKMPIDDSDKAIFYFEASAAKGDKEAYYRLGCIYYTGQFVAKNMILVKEYWQQSIELGQKGLASVLGKLYYHGQGSNKDYDKAFKFFMLAEKEGDINGLVNLGVMYLNGHAVPKDYKKAQELFELGKEQENAYAINNLGHMYELGYCSNKTELTSVQIAFQLYQESAKKNCLYGYYNLGRAYSLGIGTQIDLEKSMLFYTKAATLGHLGAIQVLKAENPPQSQEHLPLNTSSTSGSGLQRNMHFSRPGNGASLISPNSKDNNKRDRENNINEKSKDDVLSDDISSDDVSPSALKKRKIKPNKRYSYE